MTSRTRRYLMGLAIGEPVAMRATLLVLAFIACTIAALGGGWLIWQAPHCRSAPTHGHYTPPAMESCR